MAIVSIEIMTDALYNSKTGLKFYLADTSHRRNAKQFGGLL